MAEISNDKLLFHSQVLQDLHSVFTPHVGQVEVGKALFYEGKKRIFIECGRKWGKTEMLIYCLYRTCLMSPNMWCYYIAPFKDQIRDLVWSNNRLPFFLPEKMMVKYGITVNNSDFRISFRNGSFIKCDGADNYEKGRGYSATGLAVYDEFKDHNPNFHDGFEPNLGITDAPLIIIGTPPDASEPTFKRWCSIADECRDSAVGFHICMPSMTNPHISREFFARKEEELKAKGEYWKWQKEYLAMRVRAAGLNLFPMLSREKHIKSYKEMIDVIGCFPKQWDFYGAFDPGSAKCFAFICGAINRYSKQIFILDQIYATTLADCRVDNVLPKAIEMMRNIMPHKDSWLCVYDYAATWFMNESQSPRYIDEINLVPCTKDLNKKENKISLLKDILLKPHCFYMSERCVQSEGGLYWEMERYATDEKGRIPKENDHAIDALRYMMNAANFDKVEFDEPISEQELFPERRGFRLHEDYSMNNTEDIYGDVDRDLFGSDDNSLYF
jgi:hypothetical protein